MDDIVYELWRAYDAQPIEARRKHPRTGEYQWCIVQNKRATTWHDTKAQAWKAWEARNE